MSTENLTAWDALARPPAEALKTIKGGRLQGMTDVNPQWRYKAMTAQFGPCGDGWTYEIKKLWTEPGVRGEVLAFAKVVVRVGGEEIPGIGGSKLIAEEKDGLRSNDEAYKMAVTDALSVALKMLGVAADIYAGMWDGSKYRDEDRTERPTPFDETGYRAWIDNLSITAKASTFAELVETVNAGREEFKARLRADKRAWADLKDLTRPEVVA